jgi:hypothetical protein
MLCCGVYSNHLHFFETFPFWKTSLFFLAVFSVRRVLAANKEPSDKNSKGHQQFLFTRAPDTLFGGLHLFHHQPSIIPVGPDSVLEMQIQNKIAENLSMGMFWALKH